MSEPGPDDVVVRTERLDVVGHWAPEHLDAFAVLNADPEVMTFLGGPVGREDSDAFAAYGQRWVAEGLGLLPVVRRDDGVLVGMCGMHRHRWYPDDRGRRGLAGPRLRRAGANRRHLDHRPGERRERRCGPAAGDGPGPRRHAHDVAAQDVAAHDVGPSPLA